MEANKNMIDIIFFERPLADLRKFAFKIATYLKRIEPSLKLATISIELPNESEKNSIDYCYLRKEVKDIDSFLTEHKVKIVVFTNPRIPDMEMILHAHKLRIKTVMIQEGVIFEGANINDVNTKNVVSSLGYISKTMYYLHILHRMCIYDKRSYIGLLKEILFKKHNITSIVAHYFSPYLLGDYVFTMGEYWSDYYINIMKYSEDCIRVMGDHDLDGYAPAGENEVAICYISTVLVEDGTRSKAEFNEFIMALSKCIDKQTKLYIKLHPRSDERLYEILKERNAEFIRDGNLPSANVYIGHRSTLLARALYESDNLIIWKFHNEKHDFFEKYALDIVDSEESLKESLDKIDLDKKSNSKRSIMNSIFYLNPNGANRTAAEYIYEYISKGHIDVV